MDGCVLLAPYCAAASLAQLQGNIHKEMGMHGAPSYCRF